MRLEVLPLGAWGERALDNDHALDWLWDLDEARVEHQLNELFIRAVEAPRGDLSVGEGEEVMAGAEVVASAGGRPPEHLPKDCARAAGWIKGLSGDLVDQAIAAVDRVEAESGLRDAWDDSGGSRKWRDAVQELRERLNAARA